MTSLFEDPLLWVLLVVLIAAIFAVMRARRTNIQLRANNNKLHGDVASVRGQLAELQTTYSSVSARHAADLEEVRKDAESATKATLKSAVGTLATLAEEQLALLDGLQQKYGDDHAVLGDLMLVDHTGSQFSRRTKGISVLCGGWLGRRDRDASVYDVARSAQGRIRDFERVTGKQIGMKPAGGIKTAKEAISYLVVLYETLGPRWMTPDWFRFGASSLLNDVLMQLEKERTGAYQRPDHFTLD